MQESLYQTVDAEVSLSDSGGRSLSIRQRMQSLSIRQRMRETLYQTADAEVSLSNSGCRSLSIRQLMQKTLYQTVAASDRVSPAYV